MRMAQYGILLDWQGLISETSNGRCLCVVNLEDGQQFCDLEHLVELGAEVAQPER
jgi:hypothetical protein